MSLAKALAAAQRGDDDTTRTELIAAWRSRRSPAIAELVELVAGRAPDDISRQLAELVTPRVATTHARLKALGDLDDPRLATFALGALANPPFTAISAQPFLVDLLRTLERLGDPRVHDSEPAIRDALRVRMSRAPMRDALLRQLARTVGATKPARAPKPAEAELERQLASRFEGLRATTRSADTLLADIYANPDDDAPRLVYADVLQQRGDPRGEFIALQLQRPATPEQLARETELIKKHGKQWLGSLVSVLSFGRGYSGTRFERGFVQRADIILSVGKKLEPLLEDPAWATVEQLLGSWELQLLYSAPLRALRSIDRTLDMDAIALLATRLDGPLPLRSLDVPYVSTVGTMVHPEVLRMAFSRLETLRIYHERPTVDLISEFATLGLRHLVIDCYLRTGELAAARQEHTALLAQLQRTQAVIDQLSVVPPWMGAPKPVPVELRRVGDRYELTST